MWRMITGQCSGGSLSWNLRISAVPFSRRVLQQSDGYTNEEGQCRKRQASPEVYVKYEAKEVG